MKCCAFFLLLLTAWLVGGCSTARIPELGPRYEPSNIHTNGPMPDGVRRVALLPIALSRHDVALASGAEELTPVLDSELRKTLLFEVVNVTGADLKSWTGRAAWRADEALPQDFFSLVREHTGCDAVLFSTLTTYKPYPPVAVGWNLRLVAGQNYMTVWAVDETLDAGFAPVGRAARDYGHHHFQLRGGEAGTLLQSPNRFGRFSLATLFGTLPAREKDLKKE